MTIIRVPVAVIILAMILSACGQSGPLYLPEDQARVVVPVSSQQAADAEANTLLSPSDEEELKADDAEVEEADDF